MKQPNTTPKPFIVGDTFFDFLQVVTEEVPEVETEEATEEVGASEEASVDSVGVAEEVVVGGATGGEATAGD